MQPDFSTLFIWFVLYSLLGWVYETFFCTLQNRRWCNRGLLISPCCPIYGAGAVLDVLVCTRFAANPFLVFFICMAGSAVLEYLTSLVLEKVFHTSCWDYSTFPLNLHGRICLPAAFCFGVGGVLVLYLLQPVLLSLTLFVPNSARQVIALLLMALLAADTTLTAARLTPLDHRVANGQQRVDTHMEKTCRSALDLFNRFAA